MDTEPIDDIGRLLLEALAENARLSYRELGVRVGLTAPAVAERMRRMERDGIIRGYRVDLDMAKVGFPITAMVRAEPNQGGGSESLDEIVGQIDEVIEAHRVTGSEHMWLKILARSLSDLDRILHVIWTVANTTTNVSLATVVEPGRHPVVPASVGGR